MKRVLILGGGFAGIQTAIQLQKSGKFKVTLVSDRDYLYLYPISIWVPVRQIDFKNTKVPLANIREKFPFEVIVDSVKEIKASDRQVVCENQTLSYDYLVVAFGADKMKHKGIENTLSICGKPEVSLSIRDGIDKLIEKGSGKIAVGFGGNPKDKSAVRGGPGFELMFNIHNLLKKKKIRQNFELTFFAPMEEPGARMGKGALPMLNKMFDQYQITKRFGKKITEFVPGAVVFEDGSKLESDLTLFIPASAGHHVLQNSDLPLTDAGFVQIDTHCQVRGMANVYAIGDISAMEGPEWIAKQGHVAELMGRVAAHNIISTETGIGAKKHYHESPNILCVMDTGNGAAFVFRNTNKSFIIPMPIVGHWMKRGWGAYSKITKVGLRRHFSGFLSSE
ncbi:MAG: FAD-dependent oxidoreductase [Prolixibacteraceae bacterium]|nr:FAD-dependent oxidoreductase [Prolixibacteraceae bacterium]